jgi:hypothetical protein
MPAIYASAHGIEAAVEGCFPVIHFSIERAVAPKANTRFFLNERMSLLRVHSHILYFFSKSYG